MIRENGKYMSNMDYNYNTLPIDILKTIQKYYIRQYLVDIRDMIRHKNHIWFHKNHMRLEKYCPQCGEFSRHYRNNNTNEPECSDCRVIKLYMEMHNRIPTSVKVRIQAYYNESLTPDDVFYRFE